MRPERLIGCSGIRTQMRVSVRPRCRGPSGRQVCKVVCFDLAQEPAAPVDALRPRGQVDDEHVSGIKDHCPQNVVPNSERLCLRGTVQLAHEGFERILPTSNLHEVVLDFPKPLVQGGFGMTACGGAHWGQSVPAWPVRIRREPPRHDQCA